MFCCAVEDKFIINLRGCCLEAAITSEATIASEATRMAFEGNMMMRFFKVREDIISIF